MINEFSLEKLDIPSGWTRGEGDWAGVATAIKRGETVEVIQEVGSTLWQESLPAGHSLYWEGENLSTIKARIWISFTQRRFAPKSAFPKVQWHPRVLWIGIGCERGTARELIETAIQNVCRSYHLAESAIAGIATIDTKVNETGIIELCQGRNWPLKTFPAEVLSSVEVPNPSNIAAKEVGTPSVAEAAALCAASGESLIKNPLLVPKQIVRNQNPPLLQGGVKVGSAVTVAVAVCAIDYLG
ncbi:cobalamin biosynthesis protein [Microcoleus sp. herbarium14]|uniref:cobalamin biosynthesis protein n=1 Tax=Microcoleus sp. herbarium14 TaxID=3055439 RepID=UPI002FCED2F3